MVKDKAEASAGKCYLCERFARKIERFMTKYKTVIWLCPECHNLLSSTPRNK
jgi:hypothetical protein